MKNNKNFRLDLLFKIRNVQIAKRIYDLLPKKIQKLIRSTLLVKSTKNKITTVGTFPKYFKKSNPKVSIILPNFNHQKYLGISITSVLAQNYPNFELIIVDDGSTDNSKQVLQEFKNNLRIKILMVDHVGLWAALNTGFDHAEGDLFTWTSADNSMEPSAVKLLAESFNLYPNAGLMYSNYQIIDENNKPFFNSGYRKYDQVKNKSNLINNYRKQTLLNSIPDNFVGPYFMYRREVAEKVGLYRNLEGFEDYDYWLRINFHFNICYVHTKEPLYNYRIHENTLSSRVKELETYNRLKAYLMRESWKNE